MTQPIAVLICRNCYYRRRVPKATLNDEKIAEIEEEVKDSDLLGCKNPDMVFDHSYIPKTC